MTYETWIGIDIAGIRRGIRIVFEYEVETINGIKQPVHDSVYLLLHKSRIPAKWVYHLMGPRQLAELQAHLIKHSKSRRAA